MPGCAGIPTTAGGGWARGILAKLDLFLRRWRRKWPARVVAPGQVVGTLTPMPPMCWGCAKASRWCQGGADALIGMIGLGVAQPGQLALITGSSHLQFGVTQAPLHAPGVWGAYPDIVSHPGRWIVEGGQTSTGSIINWLRRVDRRHAGPGRDEPPGRGASRAATG